MKKLLFAGVMLASLCFVACTKTTPAAPPATNTNQNPIVGSWVGTYQLTDAAYLGYFYYSFALFPDNTIIQQGGGTKWTDVDG